MSNSPGISERCVWLTELEKQFSGGETELSIPGISVLGYGEISTVLAADEQPDVVLKRMAGFQTEQEVSTYKNEVEEYIRLLQTRDLNVLKTQVIPVSVHGRTVVYLVQTRIPKEAIGNHILLYGSDAEWTSFQEQVLLSTHKVLSQNSAGPSCTGSVGLDAQISNWANLPTENGEARAVYLDVGTPLYRQNGQLCSAPALTLRSLPRPMAFLLQHTLFEGVVSRYFLPREVLKDIAANFYKEGKPERIGIFLRHALSGLQRYDSSATPLSEQEVRAYYREDKFIWTLFQALRRFDRFVTQRILRRRYEFFLPGPVRR